MRVVHAVLLFGALFGTPLSGCYDHENAEPANAIPGQAVSRTASQVVDADIKQWPYYARITITFSPDRGQPKGVNTADFAHSMKASVLGQGESEYSLESLRSRLILTSNGTAVRLSEVADVEVVLFRRTDVSSNSSKCQANSKDNLKPDSECVARLALRFDKGANANRSVEMDAVIEAIDRLSPGKELGLEDIRSLMVPTRQGSRVHLAEVAEVEIVLKDRCRKK